MLACDAVIELLNGAFNNLDVLVEEELLGSCGFG